jgi:siderophore synthetase component|tara:strand:+ start:392 stop:652 length:261 start_codon:yes stop_codon:yes gene_type:complete
MGYNENIIKFLAKKFNYNETAAAKFIQEKILELRKEEEDKINKQIMKETFKMFKLLLKTRTKRKKRKKLRAKITDIIVVNDTDDEK